MDGVILDSMPYHVKAWQEALSEWSLWVPERLLYLHEGAIEPETAVAIFRQNQCPINEADFHKILKRQKEIFTQKYQYKIRPYPKVPVLLKRLRDEGWELALVTSSHQEILKKVLPTQILELMSHVVTGDQVKRRKPYPDPYLMACTALGASQIESLVVENAPAGIRSAKAAGLTCLALTTTLPEQDLNEADKVLPSHEALEEYLCCS